MENVKRATLARLSLVICLSLLTVGCGSLRDLRVTGCKVLSVTPHGFTALEAVLRLDIDNPGPEISLRDISASIHKDGRDIARISAGALDLAAACSRSYDASCSLKILGGLSLLDIENLVKVEELSSYLVDIEASVRRGKGKYRTVRLPGVPLDRIIKI